MPFLSFLAVLVQVPAEAPADPEPGLGTILMYAFFIGAMGIALAAAVWSILRARNRLSGQDQEMAEAEAAFERQALAEVGATAPAPPVAAPPHAAPAVGATPAAIPPPLAAAPGAGVDAPPASIDELADRLRALNVLTVLEGRVPMPIPPDGQIWRLRSGGVALLLPRLESETFLNHQCRRFDLVLCLTASGEVLALERFQQKLTALLAAPTAKGR